MSGKCCQRVEQGRGPFVRNKCGEEAGTRGKLFRRLNKAFLRQVIAVTNVVGRRLGKDGRDMHIRRSAVVSSPLTFHGALTLLLAFVLVISFGPVTLAQSFWDELLAGFESSIGAAVAVDVQEEYGEPARLSAAQQRWIDTIFAEIVLQAERKDITYSLQVLDSDVVNAFAAPGGYIFLTTALLTHIDSDTDALANVIGHEVAHVEFKHGMNTLGRNLGLSLLFQLAFGNPSETDAVLATVAGISVNLMQLGWSRNQEHEADELGQRLAAKAGYDPKGMVRFFRTLQQLEGMEVPFLEFLQTHPLTSERINRAQRRADTLTVTPRTLPKPVYNGG